MYTFVRRFIKTGIGFLAAGLLLGAYMLIGRELFGIWPNRYLVSAHVHVHAVGVMMGMSAVHDFVLGPRASRLRSGSPGAVRARRGAAWLARLNALVGIVLAYAAVRLARGG